MQQRSFTLAHGFFIVWFIALIAVWMLESKYRYDWTLPTLFGLVSLLGVVMFIDLAKNALLAIKAESWPTTHSQVKNSQVRTSTRSSSNSSTSLRYWADFDFSYCVAGVDYTHAYQNPNPKLYNSQAEAKVFIDQVKAGKHFSKIYYNPNNASESFIEPGLLVHHKLGIPVAMLLIVLPILTHFKIIVWQ